MQVCQLPGWQEGTFCSKRTFSAFRNKNHILRFFVRMVSSVEQQLFPYPKEKNHEEVKSGVINGGHRTRSGRSSKDGTRRLLLI
jgi:hypothetical protein